jgi:predicted ribosome quality control (RQC) complex YloA/Tae2 family protein
VKSATKTQQQFQIGSEWEGQSNASARLAMRFGFLATSTESWNCVDPPEKGRRGTMTDRDQLLRERNAWRDQAVELEAKIERMQKAIEERDGVIEMILLRELRLREALTQIREPIFSENPSLTRIEIARAALAGKDARD